MAPSSLDGVEQAAALQHLVSAGQWRWDGRHDVLTWSTELERIYGFEPGEGPRTRSGFMALVHPEDRHQMHEVVERAWVTRRRVKLGHRMIRADGCVRTLRASIDVELEDGEVVGMRGACWDITERVELERHLEHVRGLAAAGLVATGLAHDLNNLVGALVLSAGSLARRSYAPDAPRMVGQLAELGDRVREIARRIGGIGRPVLDEPATLDVDREVRRIAGQIQLVLPEHVALIADTKSHAHVRLAVIDLERLLWNLIINARDAQENEGRISVITHRDTEVAATSRAAFCRITVADDGCGMDQVTQRQIFEPFFTSKGANGTGVGLVVVRGIVKSAGGHVTIDSSPGRGTRVHIHLPCSNASEE